MAWNSVFGKKGAVTGTWVGGLNPLPMARLPPGC